MLGVVVWIIFQASAERNQRKWRGRLGAPLALRVRGDAVAVFRQAGAHLAYRRERKRSWDIEDIL